MKVLFLADAMFEDLAGGSRLVARELACGLVRRGHDVTFLVPKTREDLASEEIVDNVRIVRYPHAANPIQMMRNQRAAAQQLRDNHSFDVIHTHFAYAALGVIFAENKQTPHVRTFHGPWDQEGWIEDISGSPSIRRRLAARAKRALRFQIEEANLRRSAAVTVLSDFFSNEVAARYKVRPESIHKIVGGVDSERFHPASDVAAVRESLGLPTDRTILFTVRRLAPRMGLDNLIDAMPAVIAAHPNVLLLIGGSGPEKARLETRITDCDLSQNVRLLGFIPDEQLAAYYQSADRFVLPTTALEGFGLVTVEALSSGIPVIGTPVGATPEILRIHSRLRGLRRHGFGRTRERHPIQFADSALGNVVTGAITSARRRFLLLGSLRLSNRGALPQSCASQRINQSSNYDR